MTPPDAKAVLHHYLRVHREVMVWKQDGVSEYDARRPLTPTGTNLLGLVKHLVGVEAGYLGGVFGRPLPEPPDWLDDETPNVDMWASADQSRQEIVRLYNRVCAHADETIGALDLTATGTVSWWPAERREVSLQQVLVHVTSETARHAGHADIVRELIDGGAGVRPGHDNLWLTDGTTWADHRRQVERAAAAFRSD